MNETKLPIKNRKGQNVMVLVEQAQNQQGLAIVMHGLSGFKEQPQIITFADAFKENNVTVVRFDTTNTFGESDGEYKDATVTNYFEDLEDVINWAKTQDWYQEPFYLAGHSLGGISTLLYAEAHPQEIKGLAPISTVVSGKLTTESFGKEYMDKWEKTGWRVEKSDSIPGLIKRLPWSHMIDRLKYDTLPEVHRLTMPVLMIVGDQDQGTPIRHQQLLFERLPGKKEFHIIKGAPHTFRDPQHLQEIKQIFKEWINEVESE